MSNYKFMSWKCAVIKFTSCTAQHLQCESPRRFMKLCSSLKQMLLPANFMLYWIFCFKATVAKFKKLLWEGIFWGRKAEQETRIFPKILWGKHKCIFYYYCLDKNMTNHSEGQFYMSLITQTPKIPTPGSIL